MKAIVKFLQEAKTELAKVSWPDQRTVINLTLAVIGISLLFALFIGVVDYAFTEGVKWLTSFSASTTQVSTPTIDVSDIEATTESGENIGIEANSAE